MFPCFRRTNAQCSRTSHLTWQSDVPRTACTVPPPENSWPWKGCRQSKASQARCTRLTRQSHRGEAFINSTLPAMIQKVPEPSTRYRHGRIHTVGSPLAGRYGPCVVSMPALRSDAERHSPCRLDWPGVGTSGTRLLPPSGNRPVEIPAFCWPNSN